MKLFAVIVVFLNVLLFIILPGIDEYKKHKDNTKKEALKHSFVPLIIYVGLALIGFVLFEFIPRICGQIIEDIFR